MKHCLHIDPHAPAQARSEHPWNAMTNEECMAVVDALYEVEFDFNHKDGRFEWIKLNNGQKFIEVNDLRDKLRDLMDHTCLEESPEAEAAYSLIRNMWTKLEEYPT